MKVPLISIAVATFNGSRYLRQQLDSICRQTYKNIEIIVSDDNSNDSTVEILQEYRQKYGIHFVINDKNLGYTRNFENVLKLTKGELIALADQDDVWRLDKIETLARNINQYSLIYSDMSLIDREGALIAPSRIKKYFSKDHSNYSLKELLFRNYIAGCSMLIKREVLEAAIPFPDYYIHDYWLAVVACKINGIRFFNESLLSYRLHENNSIGMRKVGFIKDVRRIFGAEEREQKKKAVQDKIQWFNAIRPHPIFNEVERLLIDEVTRYYKLGLHDNFFSFRYAALSVKYFNYISSKNVLSLLRTRLNV